MAIDSNNFTKLYAQPQAYNTKSSTATSSLVSTVASTQNTSSTPKLAAQPEKDTFVSSGKKEGLSNKQKGLIAGAIGAITTIAGVAICIATRGKRGREEVKAATRKAAQEAERLAAEKAAERNIVSEVGENAINDIAGKSEKTSGVISENTAENVKKIKDEAPTPEINEQNLEDPVVSTKKNPAEALKDLTEKYQKASTVDLENALATATYGGKPMSEEEVKVAKGILSDKLKETEKKYNSMSVEDLQDLISANEDRLKDPKNTLPVSKTRIDLAKKVLAEKNEAAQKAEKELKIKAQKAVDEFSLKQESVKKANEIWSNPKQRAILDDLFKNEKINTTISNTDSTNITCTVDEALANSIKGKYNAVPEYLYHGTSPENYKKIQSEGFNLSKCQRGESGQGIYFGFNEDSVKSAYGASVVKVKYNGKGIAEVQPGVVDNLIPNTSLRFEFEKRLGLTAFDEKSDQVIGDLMNKYFNEKLGSMGYDAVYAPYSYKANCGYIAVFDPKNINIIK